MDEIPEVIKTAIMKDEKILYTRLAPKGLGGCFLTNKRLISFSMRKGTLGGKSVETFTDYSWRDLKIASIEEGIISSDVNFDMGKAIGKITMRRLPKDDAEKVCEIARKMKGAALKRSSDKQTTVQNLKYLKDMLNEDLITQAEYDAKKADILSRM